MQSLFSRNLFPLFLLFSACGVADPGAGDIDEADAALTSATNLTPSGVTASTSDTNVPANAVDGNLATRWSGYGDGAWLRLDLGAVKTVSSVKVAAYNGTSRQNKVDLQVSTDGSTWKTVWSGASSGTSASLTSYSFAGAQARYVRYLGHGYLSGGTTSLWNSVTELAVYGTDVASAAPPSGTCSVPGNILDLTNWYLTLPTGTSGSPNTVTQPQLATYSVDPYFLASDGCTAARFRAPTNGATTSGSSYPRSELREMTSNGTVKASWSTTSGTHRMFIDEAITAVPKGKQHIVAGQIHDASSDVIVIRLEYPKLYIDIGGTDGPTLDANYTLGKRFNFEFVARNGAIEVYYNGGTTPVYKLNHAASSLYFKAGAYTQSNCSTESQYGATCGASDYGEVKIYGLQVKHQ
jgi:hypothetical protein